MRILTILLFLTWLVAPLGTLFILDHNERLGSTRVKDFKELDTKLRSGQTEDIQYILDGLFERSKVTEHAIRTQNGLLFHVFRHVDNSDLISGRDGWLYYKPQFFLSDCTPEVYEEKLIKAANNVAVLRAMADIVDMEVIYSMSPNKIRVEEDGITPSVRAYAGCHKENEKLVDQVFEKRLPSLVNHAHAMLKPDDTGSHYFFKNDTHWNLLGYTNAMYQMKSAVDGDGLVSGGVPVSVSKTNQESKQMGPPRSMLLLNVIEKGPVFGENPFATTRPEWPVRPDSSKLVVHDSFYEFYDYTQLVFGRETPLLNMNKTPEVNRINGVLGEKPDLVIFNSVERAIIERFGGHWGSEGRHFRPVLAHIQTLAASDCVLPVTSVQAPQMWKNQTSFTDGVLTANVKNPSFIIEMETNAVPSCVEFRFSSARKTLIDIMLPPLSDQSNVPQWEKGHFFSVPVSKGDNKIRVILPADMRSNEVRIRPLLRPKEKIENLEIFSAPMN